MSPFVRLAGGLAVLSLVGCGGGGPVLVEPVVTHTDVGSARQALATHAIEPPRDLTPGEMEPTLKRTWNITKPAVLAVCERIYPHGTACAQLVPQIRPIVVPDPSVNAYADASNYTIGVHAGFLRSAGDDAEVVAVLAHEAAHLLFGHAHKKKDSATTGALIGGIAMGALGAAIHQPGMDTEYIGDMVQGGLEAGYAAGYLAYSPEMELEADQFAMYVLREAELRLTAGTDLIVRLHRGDVPTPVRQGDGWASYLNTHPANDYRLAAMRSTQSLIERGANHPVSKFWALHIQHHIVTSQYVPKLRHENGICGKKRAQNPNCEWWKGEPAGFLWAFRCPSPYEFDEYETWKECFQ